MAIKYISIKENRAVIECVGNETLQLSSLRVSNSESNCSSISIGNVFWSGTWTATQGSDGFLKLSGSGYWPLSEKGMTIKSSGGTANVAFAVTGTGTIVLEIIKHK